MRRERLSTQGGPRDSRPNQDSLAGSHLARRRVTGLLSCPCMAYSVMPVQAHEGGN